MPRFIAEVHDEILLNFFKVGINNSFTKKLNNYVLDNNKFILPTHSLVKSLPWFYEQGISFVALIFHDKKLDDKNLLIVDPDTFKLLGCNKNAFKNFGIHPSMSYEENDGNCKTILFNLIPELNNFTMKKELLSNLKKRTTMNLEPICMQLQDMLENNDWSPEIEKQIKNKLKRQKKIQFKVINLIILRENKYKNNL